MNKYEEAVRKMADDMEAIKDIPPAHGFWAVLHDDSVCMCALTVLACEDPAFKAELDKGVEAAQYKVDLDSQDGCVPVQFVIRHMWEALERIYGVNVFSMDFIEGADVYNLGEHVMGLFDEEELSFQETAAELYRIADECKVVQ